MKEQVQTRGYDLALRIFHRGGAALQNRQNHPGKFSSCGIASVCIAGVIIVLIANLFFNSPRLAPDDFGGDDFGGGFEALANLLMVCYGVAISSALGLLTAIAGLMRKESKLVSGIGLAINALLLVSALLVWLQIGG